MPCPVPVYYPYFPYYPPYPFMYNTSFPVGMNSYFPSNLFYCSNVNQFDDWVHELITFMQQTGLQDLIPDAHDHTIREPTPVELQGLFILFSTYVSPQSFPTWVHDYITKQLSLYDIIRHAMTLDVQKHYVQSIIKTIQTFEYHGEYPASQYTNHLDNILQKLSNIPINNYNKILKSSILNTLHGTYESIAQRFYSLDTDYSISDIYTAIQEEYFDSTKAEKICTFYFSKTINSNKNFTPKTARLENSRKTRYPENKPVNNFHNTTLGGTTMVLQPSQSFLPNHSTFCTCDQSQNEHCFIDNSTLGGMSSMNVDKKHVEDCQEIKGNKNEKVRIGHERNITVANKIPKYNNNNVTHDFKEYELANMFANKLFIRFTHFYNKIIKDIRYHIIIHPHRFRKKNIIHIIS